MNKDEPKKEPKPFVWRVPECCVKGLPSCKHVPKQQRKVKNNVGL